MFAVPASELVNGVEICERIVKKANRSIQDRIEAQKDSLNGKEQKFETLSLSIGIDFTFNREPIRYYYKRVQGQLECAKESKKIRMNGIDNSFYCKICINRCVFHDFDYQIWTKNKKNTDRDSFTHFYWPHFKNAVKLVKRLTDEKYKTRNFLYGLLEIVSDPNLQEEEIKRSNSILYYLRPRSMNGGSEEQRKGELQLICTLLDTVTRKNKEGNRNYLCFDTTHCRMLERYIRLLLLFCDERFLYSYDGKGEKEKIEFNKSKIRTMFNRITYYCYEENLCSLPLKRSQSKQETCVTREQAEKFRDFFVRSEKYDSPKENVKHGADKVQVYPMLRLTNSMLHRMKSIEHMERNIERDAAIIETLNPRSEQEYEAIKEKRNSEKKAPPTLPFNKQDCIDTAQQTGLWNNDYIDSLLVMYIYNQYKIQFRGMYPQDKDGSASNRNNSYRPYKKQRKHEN